MLKIIIPMVSLVALASASSYGHSNAASSAALKGLDCEFEDCSKPAPEVIIKEKVVYKDRPVVVEKVVVEEKIIYRDVPVEKVVVKEKVVYRDRPVAAAPAVVAPVAVSSSNKVYSATFDIPVIGVTGSSFYSYPERFHIVNDKVKGREVSNNHYLKTQTRPAWATMTLRADNALFLSKYDATIPFFTESLAQVNYHVELPAKVISDDTTIVALPKSKYKNSSGHAEEYTSCSFNGFTPTKSSLQKAVKLNGKNYLDVKCTIVLYGYNTQDSSRNIEIQSMVDSETFEFIPTYRVFPATRKGSKKAVLGSSLKKFLFSSEIE